MAEEIKIGLPYLEVGNPILAKNGLYINYFMSQVSPMWKYGTGLGVTVMVGDTGAPTHHGITVFEKTNSTNEEGVDDLHGHGANVAGILAGSHNPDFNGVQGHAPSVHLLCDKTLDSTGGGLISYIDKTIERAIEEKVDILSLSLDAPSIPSKTKGLLKKARALDIIVNVAAGNGSGTDCGGLASEDTTLTTGSLDRNGRPSSFSDKCSAVMCNWYGRDVVGFGASNIEGGQTLLAMTGTSQATPGVSGILANALSFRNANKLKLTNLEVVQVMLDTCDSLGNGPGLGHGKVNPERFIKALINLVEPVEEIEEIVDEVCAKDGTCEDCTCQSAKKSNTGIIVGLIILLTIVAALLI